MIEKVANNKTNQEILNLNSPEKVKEKLDYYRTFFNKTNELSPEQFEELKNNIATFFNIKPVGFTKNPPTRLVRISNNNRILNGQGKEVSYLTEISQLLAPPIKHCDFGRCNTSGKQVLYCAVNEASAYWETKPKNGDVITISHFELKPEAKINCNIIRKEKTLDPKISHALQEVYYMLEEFFVDVFSLEVSREQPKNYLFSALLSSEQLFYPIPSKKNIEAIIYPSVQKKKYGENLAIRNDLIFEKYNLIGVETRFILNEFENIDPKSDDLISDNLIGSFGTKTFDFDNGKILYNDDAPRIFKLFRDLQINGGPQIRYDNPMNTKSFAFDLSAKTIDNKQKSTSTNKKIWPNDRINVIYQNGTKKENIKYKLVKHDLEKGICKITKY